MNNIVKNMNVSIIMPVYNSGTFLDDAVKSILNQDFNDFELLLVDDGSTDGSAEKCDIFASEDNRVKVIHQQNGGICHARNKALTIVQGEYIAFADHDDAYSPSILRTAYTAAKNFDVDVLKFGMKELDVMEGQIIGNRHSCYDLKFVSSEDIGNEFFSLLKKGVLNYVWDGLYRTDFIREHDIFFDTYFKRGREDINFMMEVFKNRPNVATIPGLFYTHYIRKGFSTSSLINDNTKCDTYRTFSHLKTTMDTLKVDYDAIKDDYVFYLVKSFLNSNICYLSRKWKSESHDLLFGELDTIYEAPFLPPYFFSIPFTQMLSRSRKYGICYFLFKHRLWHLLLSMYYNRGRQKNTVLKRIITKRGG